MNWQKPDNDILDQYSNLMNIGYQPDLLALNQLETIDEHVEWKHQKDQAKRDLEIEQRNREKLERLQKERHEEWIRQREIQKEAEGAKITLQDI